MKSKKLILSLFGAALAGLWTAQASAAVIGYVELSLTGLTEGGWNGGGRGEFSISRYADMGGNVSYSGIFGSVPQTGGGLTQTTETGPSPSPVLYASCIEHAETVQYNEARWYAIHNTLVGAPSSNPAGMSTGEANLIERVVSQKFGLDFLQTDNSTFNNGEMAKLQSLLWDAGAPDKDATNPTGSWGSGVSQADVQGLINGLDSTVSIQSYALVRVGGSADNQGIMSFSAATGQDFFTYLAKPDDSTGVPVPAPLLLFGTGLLGLYGTLRRRRA